MQGMDYLRIRATLLTIKETKNNGLIFYITPILNFQKGDGAQLVKSLILLFILGVGCLKVQTKI